MDPPNTSASNYNACCFNGNICSMSRAGTVWDIWSDGESSSTSLKTERKARKVYSTSDAATRRVFDYIERFYNPRRRNSKLSYLKPIAFGGPSYANVTGSSSPCCNEFRSQRRAGLWQSFLGDWVSYSRCMR